MWGLKCSNKMDSGDFNERIRHAVLMTKNENDTEF